MTNGLILFIFELFSASWLGGKRMGHLIEFAWPIRVYYEDTDAGGVVYHARYLHFLERARTEWLRTFGVEQDRMIAEQGLVFLVARLAIDYLRPARFNQELRATVTASAAGGVRLPLRQEIRDLSGTVYCRAEVIIVCARASDLKPVRLPRFLTEEWSHGHP